jgi:hypothetical protein
MVMPLLSEGEQLGVDLISEPEVGTLPPLGSAQRTRQRVVDKWKTTLNIGPLAARDVEWRDPFYDNRHEILVAFDVDYEKLEKELVTERRAKCTRLYHSIIATGLVFCFFWFLAVGLSDLGLYITITGICIFSRFALRYAASMKTKEMILLMRRHIAITKEGVCLDDSDEPGSLNLVRRQVIKFGSIVKCCVKDVGWFRPSYRVWIYPEGTEDGNAACRAYSIRGLVNGQEFVDIVQAMADRASNVG